MPPNYFKKNLAQMITQKGGQITKAAIRAHVNPYQFSFRFYLFCVKTMKKCD